MYASGFAVVDAMAEYAFDDKTSLKLNVSNLFDRTYAGRPVPRLHARRPARCAGDAEDTLLTHL